MKNHTEQWRPVVGWEGLYEVSNHGRVRACDRWIDNRHGTKTFKPGHQLKLIDSNPVYACGKRRQKVALTASGRKPLTPFVHRLVAEAFLGPAPEKGMLVRHLDDDPTHNTPDNLIWGTYQENAQDRVRNGNDFNTNVTHCKFGHELCDKNLVKKQKGRACLACARARAYTCRYPQLKPYKLELGDAYYRAIMEGDKSLIREYHSLAGKEVM